ncbi:hypothetical protein D3C81_2184060 [compost metagenome]
MLLAKLQRLHKRPVPRTLGKTADNIRKGKAFGFGIQPARFVPSGGRLIQRLLQIRVHHLGIQPEQVIEGH